MPKVPAWIAGILITAAGLIPSDGSAAVMASQTLSLYRYDGENETTVSYTAVGKTGSRWRVRGSVSWWRWDPSTDSGLSTESGAGTLDLTLGRSLWSSYGPQVASRGWVQVKGTIPLAEGPSPLSSGEFDWGLSLLNTNRIRDFLLFVELGYLSPGDPVGVSYNSRVSAAASASWRPRGIPFYPVASYARGGSVTDGVPGFGEWSAGLGARLGSRTGVMALYTQGTTASSPDRGFSLIASFRL
jgi:hypothetical protein